MSKIINKIAKHYINYRGWKTNRKIVVIESDDWGSIRMPSKRVYEQCLKDGYQVDENIFSRYDSLASEEDLELLFELLSKYSDFKGNHPIITANCLVANPDFEQIEKDNYQQYTYELITETFKNYPRHRNCFELWLKGKESGVFFPQFHGREHLNVNRFITDLQLDDEHALYAFRSRMPGIFNPLKLEQGNDYIVSLEYKDDLDEIEKCNILADGLRIFEQLMGYNSDTFIATNYVWSSKMEETLYKFQIKAIQGSRFQLVPKGNYDGFRKKLHYTGQKNRFGQTYLVRNAYFEPSLNQSKDWVESTIFEIEKAFQRKSPAIICTHRINFVGFIDVRNRDRSLKMLNELIRRVLSKWPEVEFMNTSELFKVI